MFPTCDGLCDVIKERKGEGWGGALILASSFFHFLVTQGGHLGEGWWEVKRSVLFSSPFSTPSDRWSIEEQCVALGK